jgi:hypothetical protein
MLAYSQNIVAERKFFSIRNFTNLICIASFFPFFAFVPGITAEVQPYCYLITLVYIFLFRQKLPVNFYFFYGIVILYFLYYLFTNLLYIDINALPHIIIFIGPPMFFYTIYKNFHKLNLKIIHNIFYIWTIVGVLQELSPVFFSVTRLKDLFEFLIPRFSSESLKGFGDRGVTSLSNEPSYAAIIYFTSFLVIIYRYLIKEISRAILMLSIVLYIFSLVYNASLTMFILTCSLLVAVIFQTRKYFLSLSIIVSIALFFTFFDTQFRVVALLKAVPDMIDAVGGDWLSFFASSLGSIREFSVYIGVKSVFYHFFGNGYYSSLMHFIDVAKEMHVDLSNVRFFDDFYGGRYINMKPAGFGALILFEFGFIPFLIVLSVPVKILVQHIKTPGKYKRLGFVIAITSLLLMNFNALSSLPCYWFALVVAVKIISLQEKDWTDESKDHKISALVKDR